MHRKQLQCWVYNFNIMFVLILYVRLIVIISGLKYSFWKCHKIHYRRQQSKSTDKRYYFNFLRHKLILEITFCSTHMELQWIYMNVK